MTMQRHGWMAGLVLGTVVAGVVGIAAAQRAWNVPVKPRATAPAQRATSVLIGRPQALIAGGSSGLFCTDAPENAVGVHDLGAIPAGLHVTVTVESYDDEFDPVAAVVVPTIGLKAASTVKVQTFYDNDSGGEKDPRIDFVTPQTGTYVLLVGDFTDTTVGCYRYQVLIQ